MSHWLKVIWLCLLLSPFSAPSLALEPVENIPQEIVPFIPQGEKVIVCTVEDMNGDKKTDAIVVLENKAESKRTLLALIRNQNNKLELHASNTSAILCDTCGGMMGDPFDGIEKEKNGFWIYHYGGTGWRWRQDFRFAWSKRDKTWQLVEVKTLDYHTSDPDAMTSESYKPPKDFGLINLAEFDVEDWEGKGKI